MEGLNKVMLLGNIGADPEFRETGSGAVLKIRLATSEKYLDRNKEKQERTEWHSCVLWGKRAESLVKYLTKGSRVYVEGRLQTSSFEDRSGAKRYKTEINVTEILLQGGGNRGRSSAGPAELKSDKSRVEGFEDPPSDDDLPF